MTLPDDLRAELERYFYCRKENGPCRDVGACFGCTVQKLVRPILERLAKERDNWKADALLRAQNTEHAEAKLAAAEKDRDTFLQDLTDRGDILEDVSEKLIEALEIEAERERALVKLLREGLEFARCEIPGETERDRKLGLYKR